MLNIKTLTAFLAASAAALGLAFTASAAESDALPLSLPKESYAYTDAESSTELPFDISDTRATIPYLNYTYTGKAIEPEPTLKINGVKLVKGVDYDVSYSDNVEVGSLTATVTLTGKGSFTGSTERQFNIKPNDISDNRATIPYLNYTYTGKAITPEPTLKINGVKLVKDRDYTVSYKNNVKCGQLTATVTLTGMGSYTGTTERQFNINPRDISSLRATIPYISYTYKGTAIKPTPTLKYNGEKLVSGTDYTVSYKNNVNCGELTATVTLTGKGSFKGSTTRQFTIKQNDISDNRATIPSLNYDYKGSAVKPTPTLKINGIKLVAGTDYTVSYSANNKPGVGTVKLTGKGNFKGTTSRTFNINKLSQGWHTISGNIYYFGADGLIVKTGSPDGYTVTSTGAMTAQSAALKAEVDSFIEKYTKPTASAEDNLRAVFLRVSTGSTYERLEDFDESAGWQVRFAYYIMTKHKGNCYKFGAEFCYLARALGFDAKCVVARCAKMGGGTTPHCWVEINMNGTTYVYDPDMYNATRNIGYYKFTYSTAPMAYYKNLKWNAK
ncbi:MAG: transglutaminase domain-containing protein [Ruminococcus sp.]|nr:transglutaminase domain-containing protein [Ruminococcus sp.]